MRGFREGCRCSGVLSGVLSSDLVIPRACYLQSLSSWVNVSFLHFWYLTLVVNQPYISSQLMSNYSTSKPTPLSALASIASNARLTAKLTCVHPTTSLCPPNRTISNSHILSPLESSTFLYAKAPLFTLSAPWILLRSSLALTPSSPSIVDWRGWKRASDWRKSMSPSLRACRSVSLIGVFEAAVCTRKDRRRGSVGQWSTMREMRKLAMRW